MILWLKWFFKPTGHVEFSKMELQNDFTRMKHIEYMEKVMHGKARFRVCPVCGKDFVTVWKDITCGRWSCYRANSLQGG